MVAGGGWAREAERAARARAVAMRKVMMRMVMTPVMTTTGV